MNFEKYVYKNCPIPGGGYVTGFIFHEKYKDILYIRTDIGGVYRFEPETETWHSLIDHVTMENPEETFPIAVALDHDDPDMLYIMCGINNIPSGMLAISHDRGDSFEYYRVPFMVHGNLNGRGTGYRLIVDRNDASILYFASQQEGLWVSRDGGRSWENMPSFEEKHMTFVAQSPDGKLMVAAGAGVTTKRSDRLRGHSLYYSYDFGASFEVLAGPEDTEIDGVKFAGHIAQRYAFDSKYLYVSYSVMGRNAYVFENGYSCDGGSVIGGKIYRYSLEDITGNTVDITPEEYGEDTSLVPGLLEYGFSGINTGNTTAGLVVASTISREVGDCIFRSYDYGNNWECILCGLERGKMDFRTSYMLPKHNGGGNLIHWLTDLKIDPFDENTAWFNTGTGVFRTRNLQDETVHFSDWSDGIEETVHLNLYSPASGEVKLIDILGDLGGFAFRDLDRPCDNSFADADGNRYITCINADYPDTKPQTVIVTPRGNWTGKTKGGLIISHDNCKSFDRLELPRGLSDELDSAFEMIETPNVNSGWVAISADAKTIVWTVADGITLPKSRVVVSHDGGKSFIKAEIISISGQKTTDGMMKVFSDRVKENVFYGFGDRSDFYVSTDAGEHFEQVETPDGFPEIQFGLIDCANKTEIRPDNGRSGIFYMALAEHGMWKLTFENKTIDGDTFGVKATKLSSGLDAVYRLGLGIGRENGDYLKEDKAIYITARIDGEYGFYRTVDEGASFTRLNTAGQMFGDINSMEGDSRVFGRFFIATGSRGVIYGEQA